MMIVLAMVMLMTTATAATCCDFLSCSEVRSVCLHPVTSAVVSGTRTISLALEISGLGALQSLLKKALEISLLPAACTVTSRQHSNSFFIMKCSLHIPALAPSGNC